MDGHFQIARRALPERDRRPRGGWMGLLFGLFLTAAPAVCQAADDPPTSAAAGSPAVTAAEVARKKTDLAPQLEHARQAYRTALERAAKSPQTEDLRFELGLLEFLSAIYDQQQLAFDSQAELQREFQQLSQELELTQSLGTPEKGPYSFLAYEELQDELAAVRAEVQALAAEGEAARAIIESVRQRHVDAEREKRAARETLDSERDPQRRPILERKLEMSQLYSRTAAEVVQVRLSELQRLELEQKLATIRCTLLEEKTRQLASVVRFSPADLAQLQQRLGKEEEQVKQRLLAVQAELKQIDAEWMNTRKSQAEAADRSAAAQEIEGAWRWAREVRQRESMLLNERLGRLVLVRRMWTFRYAAAQGGAAASDLQTWESETAPLLERVRQSQQMVHVRLDQQQAELAGLRQRQQTLTGPDDPRASPLARQISELQYLGDLYGAQLVSLKSIDRTLSRFLEEIRQNSATAAEHAWLPQLTRTVGEIANFELAVLADRPLTVKKVLLALALFTAGLVVARTTSRALGRRVLPRLGANESLALTLQTIVFYLLITVVGFITLETAHVPLTAFTFLGGAVAIGVGFGSQNLMNNFISGLILHAERPLRIGDYVEVDGIQGTVQFIGARSTRIKTGMNLELVIPNSKLLENTLTNWTLSDTRVRSLVTVGVAYGSPTRDVVALLDGTVRQHPKVQANPEPIVLFADFGADALMFEVHFWISMRTNMERRVIESELRLLLDDAFRAAQITVAFPQRDIHLDTSRPLEIHVRNLAETPSFGSAIRRVA